jgi:membrane fusion protein, multidrug efflux system
MYRLKRFLTVAFVSSLVVGAAWAIVGPAQQITPRSVDSSVPVQVAKALVTNVPIYLDGVGTARALNMVAVHSQVDGILVSINFREGHDVKTGDVLARVDPRTYQAQLDQQVAKKALDEAQLANAARDLDRYSNLVQTNAVTRQQYDTQRALVAQFEAQVKFDQGAVDNAQTLLDYCTILSPIDGRAGIRQVDRGNIVHASDTTGIVVLTQIQPIAVVFTLPQQQLPQVNKAFVRASLTADAIDSGTRAALDHGTLTVVNNQVDQSTGTVQLKAEFPNTNLQIWPGQFVNIRLLIATLEQVVTVPTSAVQRGPNGTFVYLLQDDGTVSVRPVVVTQQDESRTVIAAGVAEADRVVTSGSAQLSNGRSVTVANGDDVKPGSIDNGGKTARRGDSDRPDQNESLPRKTSQAVPSNVP